jgi:hypothetical protein
LLDPLRANDPRLSHQLAARPLLRAWLERAIARETSAAPPGPPDALTPATAGLYLAVKLSDAGRYALAVEIGARTLPRKANALREYLQGWVRLSMDLDAYVFATYGALDALAHVVVAVQAIRTDEEVKFPLLPGILAASGAEPASVALGERIADTLAAPWYRELRYLRNLINYRSVLPAAPRGGLPLGQPRAPWLAPPLAALNRLDALPPWARDTLARVGDTVETVVSLLPERHAREEPLL